MKYRESLQVKLQERYRLVAKTTYAAFARELSYFRDFIVRTPALRVIVEAIEQSEPDLDPKQWIEEKFQRGYDWPASEDGRAKIAWSLVKRWAAGEDAFSMAVEITREDTDNDAIRAMVPLIVEPLVSYLQERLGTESDVLYLLERYRRRVELFERERLHKGYEADTARGEKLYDADLRRFLFDQGIDYPFSQPASASGLADIISGLEGDDPLVCEVKLFDGDSYGAAYLAKGFNQALQYAHDYGKTSAYLVIFNLSARALELPTDDATKGWPPRLQVSGVTVYIAAVRALPVPAASKQGKANPFVITRETLVTS